MNCNNCGAPVIEPICLYCKSNNPFAVEWDPTFTRIMGAHSLRDLGKRVTTNIPQEIIDDVNHTDYSNYAYTMVECSCPPLPKRPWLRRYYGKIFCGSDINLLDSILHEIDHTDYSVYW